jgi:pyruvate dehydrogenase E1 component
VGSLTAAGTSYATFGEPMIPFYFFYSMFGFQRTADSLWAFSDARGKGFVMGATAGRTTLNGEGLQHQDGHSQVLASTFPSVKAYDPAFAYEVSLIIKDGLRRMYRNHEEIFYYLTIYNENYVMPAMPEGAEEGVLRGMYLLHPGKEGGRAQVVLLGSGTILREVLKAREILEERFDLSVPVMSATSYQLLRRDALKAERKSMLHPEDEPRIPYVQALLAPYEGPFVAASDFMKLVPDQIRQWVPGDFHVLGTDGFGMSDTREALRRHFEVDAESIVLAALHRLARAGKIERAEAAAYLLEIDLEVDKIDPLDV